MTTIFVVCVVLVLVAYGYLHVVQKQTNAQIRAEFDAKVSSVYDDLKAEFDKLKSKA